MTVDHVVDSHRLMSPWFLTRKPKRPIGDSHLNYSWLWLHASLFVPMEELTRRSFLHVTSLQRRQTRHVEGNQRDRMMSSFLLCMYHIFVPTSACHNKCSNSDPSPEIDQQGVFVLHCISNLCVDYSREVTGLLATPHLLHVLLIQLSNP
jgi:hypothetical protein